MKVVEKLFVAYSQIPADNYLDKYIAATGVVRLTDSSGASLSRLRALSSVLSTRYPVSVHLAKAFLDGRASRLSVGKTIVLDKARGDDLAIRQDFYVFLEEVHGVVVASLENYNTDRARRLEEALADDRMELFLRDE